MNNQESGTTECGPGTFPPVEVIRVEIDAELLNAIKRQITDLLPDLKEEVEAGPIPVSAFIALPGNRVIRVVAKGANIVVPGPDDKFAIQSLIDVAMLVAKGSHISGTTVGGVTEFIDWG